LFAAWPAGADESVINLDKLIYVGNLVTLKSAKDVAGLLFAQAQLYR
jgi:dTDP-D-glucose 4,6-dehydratase